MLSLRKTFTKVTVSERARSRCVHVHPCRRLRPGKSTSSRGPKVADHQFSVSDGIILLCDSEDFQGEPAAQGDLELVTPLEMLCGCLEAKGCISAVGIMRVWAQS